ncbi:MAG: SPFH domain-containing protein [Planctomycetaceae bacterium]|nr:SPFH domain-containing protein [Planctomycetaceae bacterium]
MGLFDKLRNELIDIIEWVDDSRHTLVWRFPRYQNEIKNGAQLIVRPGQMAVFVHRGQVADVFEPGHHELKTDNLPILSTLSGWKYGFNSPFKAEVYFVSTKQITDLKWGTPNPVMLRDPEFGPIRIRAFGTYAIRATNPKALLTELVGTDQEFGADAVTELLRSIIIATLAETLAKANVAALDLAGKYLEFGETLRKAVQEKIDDEYGLEIPQLIIVNISLPEAVEKALDTRTSMGVIGDMNKFQQFQIGQAMTAGGGTGGSPAAEGVGLGVGLAMAGRMLQPGAVAGGVAASPPPIVSSMWHVAVNGQSQGPYAIEQVASAIAAGQVTKSTLVWTAGMANWVAAGTVPQLAGSFGPPAPPPVPAP